MNSLLLRVGSRPLIPLIALFSVYILLRGHNEPGGGFIGGLLLAIAAILHGLANGTQATRKLLRLEPVYYLGLGWSFAIFSGIWSLLLSQQFMTAQTLAKIELPILGKTLVGSVLLFDVGVYFLVFGTVCQVLFGLLEKD
jgi:multicomponent Na+:H+ antiporter subunit B